MFTIIIPVHNSELYIKECLDSILKQNQVLIEVLIIIDHCCDNTEKICRSYSAIDNRVKVIINNGKGVSSSRNIGIEAAKGKYLVFVDSDDILLNDALNKYYLAMEGTDIVVSGYRTHKGNEVREYTCENVTDFYYDLKDLLRLSLIQSVWAKCFKKSIIIDNNIRFDESLDYGEDTSFLYSYLGKANEIKVISDITYEYRINAISLSHKYIPDKLFIDVMLCKKLIEMCRNKAYNIDGKSVRELWICQSIITFLPSIVCNNNYKNYYSIISRMFSDDYIMYTVKKSADINRKWSIIRYLILNKHAIAIYFIYRLIKLYRGCFRRNDADRE